jgi:GTP-binding protein
MLVERNDLRNIAIIAHVDHGKTTLVDGMLKQAHVFRINQQVAERILDSSDLERERGITILAKNTAITIPDSQTGEQVKINIVDTPGHADFGGEVERVLNMVDGVLLLVDAAEGPMPQTRFVLRKALELGLRAIVVINKIDRKDADLDRTLDATFDLFIELGASDAQADFPVVYAIATQGLSGLTADLDPNLQALFETILREISPPVVEIDAPLQMLVTSIEHDSYRGLTAIGRIFSGKIQSGDPLARITLENEIRPENAQYLFVHEDLKRVAVESAEAGEIVAIAGLDEIEIGETLADAENPIALPVIRVEKPTVRMMFGVNTSPFGGRDGRWGTSRKIRERLFNELKHNVSLRVEDTEKADEFIVSGRGELHLAILIETMRREGYEFHVSRPEVILLTGAKGETLEPYEDVTIEIPPDAVGTVVEMLGKRRGKLESMSEPSGGIVHLAYIAPTRGLLGFRYQFLTATHGMGQMNSVFHGYGPMAKGINARSLGALVAWETGTSTTYGLRNAEIRGTLFIGPGVEVYQGMVIGEQPRTGDLNINVCKKRHLTAIHTELKTIEERLSPPRSMSLDEAIEYLGEDELLEVTPKNLRIRKRVLNDRQRGRNAKRAKKEAAAS